VEVKGITHNFEPFLQPHNITRCEENQAKPLFFFVLFPEKRKSHPIKGQLFINIFF